MLQGGKAKNAKEDSDDDMESTMKGDKYVPPPPPNPARMMQLVVRTLTSVFPPVGMKK